MIKNYNFNSFLLVIACLAFFCVNTTIAQVNYNASGTYGLRLINPGYTGNAIQVRRTCDNATKNIGFSCGALNTTALSDFVIASNPLSAVSSGTATAVAYSLRKLSCLGSNTVAVNVRRSCDNATIDIGFTSAGDFDTTSLQKFIFKSYPLSALSATAAAAYSLRKLYCAYAGNAILVRRSSDNTTQAIGFTASGDLNTTALLAFVGAGNGYIQTWYDQSGNGNNATAPANGNQPQIVAAGVVKTLNGQPTAVFDGASSYLTIPYAASLNLATASTCNAVLARTAAAAGTCDAVFAQQYTGNNISAALSWNSLPAPGITLGYGYYVQGGSGWQNAELATDIATNSDNIITGTILSGASNTTAIKLYQNGTLASSLTNQSTVGAINTGFGYNIGKRWDLGNYAPINLQELIVFSSVLSTTDRQFLEFGQSAYYSISGPPSLSAIPAGAQSAYVTKWYDQSGNARDAAQATSANQPRIMNAGVIERQNGKPALFFNNTGASGYTIGLQTANINVFTSAACFLGVAAVNTNLTYNALVTKTGPTSTNYPCPFDFYYNTGANNTQMLVGNGNNGSYSTFTASKDFKAGAGLNIWTYQANGTTASGVNAYFDATTQIITNQTAVVYGDQSSPLCIGARYDGVTGLNGWVSEILTFSVIPSATDIGYLNYTEGSYYSIAGPSLGTLPSSPASAYITTWYDQSGNGKNLTQATTTNQPRIVNAGVINLQGSLPAIPLDGSNYYMGESTMSIGNPYTANAVATRTANGGSGGYQRLINISATGDSYGYMGALSGNYATFAGNGGGTWNDIAANTPNTSVALNTQAVLTMAVATGATGLVPYLNGTAQTAKVGTAATATGFLIGAPYSTSTTNQLWTGNISEVSIFSSALNTTRRTLLESNQAAYYGLTVSGTKYTAANGYNLFVNGIGCATAFTDSVAGTRQSVGMGIIDVNYLGAGNYMTIGTTCPSAAVTTSLYMPAGATAGYERWSNDWLLNYNNPAGTNGSVKLYFDFSDYGVSGIGSPANASNYQLWGRATPTSNFAKITTSAVSISGNRVIFTVPVANLTSGNYYTIGTIDYDASSLPIELLSFSAVPDGEKVDLKWETSTETNNKFFTIERSSDGKNFNELASINSKAINGNSTTSLNYLVVDQNPLNGVSYYRLKQTDYNGKYAYFNMVSVDFETSKNIKFSIYPNPNVGEFTVDFSGIENNHEVQIILQDALGKEVYSNTIYSNSISSNKVQITPSLKLAKGNYFCSIIFEGIKRTLTVVVN